MADAAQPQLQRWLPLLPANLAADCIFVHGLWIKLVNPCRKFYLTFNQSDAQHIFAVNLAAGWAGCVRRGALPMGLARDPLSRATNSNLRTAPSKVRTRAAVLSLSENCQACIQRRKGGKGVRLTQAPETRPSNHYRGCPQHPSNRTSTLAYAHYLRGLGFNSPGFSLSNAPS